MANISYKRKTVDKLSIKGFLSEDCLSITYEDKDAGDIVVSVDDCLKRFAGEDVVFSISLSEDEDMLGELVGE